jgi:p70 ribosomal S6 kinase
MQMVNFQRQVAQRLGSASSDAEQIKGHQFFELIDWNDVITRKLEPPFKPKLSSEDDVSQFDKLFTTSLPIDSPPECTLSESANKVFQVNINRFFIIKYISKN